jgi:hypothetical protein
MMRYEWGCGNAYQYVELSPSEVAELEATGYAGCFSLDFITNEINKHMGGCKFSEDGAYPHDFRRVVESETPPHMVIFQCAYDVKAKGLDLETYFVKESND